MNSVLKNISVFAAAVLFSVPVQTYYSLGAYTEFHDLDAPRLVDNAGVLSENEEDSLLDSMTALSDKYGTDVIIVTTVNTGGKSNRDYADDFYDYGGYGLGAGYDGILLLVNFGSGRGWYISTYGSAIDDFSDADIEKIGDNIKTYLSGGEYFAAFNKYLDMIEYPLSGKALPRKTSETFFYIGVCFVVGLVTAFVSTSVMRSKMNPVKCSSAANNSVVNGSFNLTGSGDYFLYKTVTKTARPKPASSSGSSVHKSSSGRSHGGGGGKF